MARPPLFAEMFWNVALSPETSRNIALCTAAETITYADLGARVAARAQGFLTDPTKPRRIAVLQERSAAQCVDILAGLCSGVSVTVLNGTDAVELSADKLCRIKADLIITDTAFADVAQQIGARAGVGVKLHPRRSSTPHQTTVPKLPNGDDEALIIFTSGSTGVAKGVALSQMNVATNTQNLTNVIAVTPTDHLLQVMPLYHTNGLLNQILLPLSLGARVTLLDRFEPQNFIKALTEHQPTYFTAVPTMLTRLLAHDIPPAAIANLRFIRSGAAPLLPQAHRQVEAHFGRDVVVSYGQTETTCTNTANPPTARKIGSVGQVLGGRDVAILSPNGKAALPTGSPGEVCFRGACIAMGLVGEARFDPTVWFRTGDVGYLDADGYLFLTGRLKDIIIRGGANLSPRQIEDCVLGAKGVEGVAVLGIPHPDLGEVPVACIVPNGQCPLNLGTVNDHIVSALSPAHRLSDLFEYERLPLNDIGKVDTRQLARDVAQIRDRRGTAIRCEDDTPLRYIDRTRHYYATLGFGTPYEWVKNDDIPFAPMPAPLTEAKIGIVTTAALFQSGAGDQGPGAPYNAAAKFYKVYRNSTAEMPDLRISHIAIDRDNTRADDIGAYFPLSALERAAASGQIGQAAEHFYGLPTNRSKRITVTQDAEALLAYCKQDGVDAAIFVPNCPVCHQSVTLTARVLEAAGIATVIMGCASDIVLAAGAPRFVFNDFPLGNAAGRPHDVQSQAIVMRTALSQLEDARAPGTMVQSPLKWVGRADWKTYYANPDLLSADEIKERRRKFEEGKDVARALRVGGAT